MAILDLEPALLGGIGHGGPLISSRIPTMLATFTAVTRRLHAIMDPRRGCSGTGICRWRAEGVGFTDP
jgi:hypothetical protein